jgi:GT2 family glycosyltransferase
MAAPGKNRVEVAVVILTMNQRDKTLRCLSSFGAVDAPPYRIVLWDNGSQDGTIEAVRELFPDVVARHHPQNIGVASGRNAAARIAVEHFSPIYLFFLDNDMTVTPRFLEALVEPFAGDSRLAQTTGKIRIMDDEQRIYGAGGCRTNFWLGDTKHVGYTEIDYGQYDEAKACMPSGGCMLVRADIFQQLGGFDTVFDPYGPEDLDFGFRVAKAGYYGLYVPRSVVFHDTRPGRTFEGGAYTQTYASHRARNWFVFMRRHASPLQRLGFLVVGIPYSLSGLIIREGKKGNLLTAMRGLARGTLDYWKSSLTPRS